MSFTYNLTNYIKNKKPIVFVRYGDGEINSIKNINIINGDNVITTLKIQNLLKYSLEYFHDKDDVYIGEWHDKNMVNELIFFVSNPQKIKWVNYHTLHIGYDVNDIYETDKYLLLKEIKNSNMPKLIICNKLLIKLKLLFNTNDFVIIPFRNWFENEGHIYFKKTYDILKKYNKINKNVIIISMSGYFTKIFFSLLHNYFPNNIYLDFGSSLDFICTKKDSRCYRTSKDYNNIYNKFLQYELFNDKEWDSDEFNWIYDIAKHELGIHL